MLDTSALTLPNTTPSTNNAASNSSTSGSSSAQRGLDSTYSDFLKLLTTQLQNQDPTAPTDTNQLTQQIATLSQVEQQINTNKNLEQLISLMNATQYNSVLSYIGQQIEAPGNQGALEAGKAPFAYYLPKDAATVAITIKDATGNVVYTGTGPTAGGRNEFTWDGKNNNGQAQPEGIYSITVSAKDSSHNDITAQTYTTGTVSSIDSVGGVVYATIGDILSVPVSSIQSVRRAPVTTTAANTPTGSTPTGSSGSSGSNSGTPSTSGSLPIP